MRPKNFLIATNRSLLIDRYSDFFAILPYLILGAFTQVISLLLSPIKNISDSTDPFCNYYITKFRVFHAHIDCDAQYFLLDSQDPMRLVSNSTPLQDRPLHSFTVFVISKVLSFLGVPVGPITYVGQDEIPQTYFLLNYIIFIFINLVILMISLYIALKALNKRLGSSRRLHHLSFGFVTLLVTQNPITREFFWTPHSQLFNILIPCLLFYLIQPQIVITRRRYWILMVTISTSLLIYPSPYTLLPIFFIKTYRNLGKKYSVLIFVSLLPKLMWPFVLNAMGGEYVDWPVRYYRRLVWIFDSIKTESLPQDLTTNLSKFINSLPFSWSAMIASLVALATLSALKSRKWQKDTKTSYFTDCVIVLGIYASGIILQGGYGPRFTTSLVVLIGLIVINMLDSRIIRISYVKALIALIVALNFIYWVRL
jgi:hypothetical protein